MSKINFKYVDQSYLSTIVKNKDNGRRYLQVTCPSCGITFDKREFYDHVLNVHAKKKDEVLSKLFGIKQFPVICSCGKEVHFNETTGIYSRKCSYCTATDRTFGAGSDSENMNLDELLEEQKRLEAAFKAKQEELTAQIEAAKKEQEWKSIDIHSSKPRFLPDAQKFVRKISYELRVHATNGDKQKIHEILNFLDRYLDNEEWKKDKEVKDD